MSCAEYTGDLYVEITNKCNLFCKHCYNFSCKENHLFISRADFSRIVDNCLNVGIKRIALSGGEPLSNPDIIPMINEITNNGIECKIVTNGTLITEDFLQKIANCKNVKFQISLHGSNAVVHESLTDVKSYERIIKSIEIIRIFHRPFSIKTIINKYNVNDIENIVLLGKEMSAQGVSVSFLQSFGRAVINDQDIGLKPIELTKYYINTIMPLFEKYEGFLTGPKIKNTRCPLIYGGVTQDKIFILSPRIDPKGLVYPCSMFISPKFSVGNIFKSSFKEIFASQKFINLATYMELREKYVETCNECAVSIVCGKGCPASSMELDIINPNVFCDTVKWKIISDTLVKK